MQDRIEFYVDKSKSPRFQRGFHYDQALNIAQDKIIQDKYDNVKQHKMYAFQVFQKIRDDLRTIVKTVPITPVGNLIQLPIDYMYEVGLALVINGIKYDSREVTYNEFNGLDDNSFTSITIEEPVHIEDENGIEVSFGLSGTFSSAILSYIKIPSVISLGPDIKSGLGVLVIGNSYYVTVGTVNDGAVRVIGSRFVALSSNMTGTGTVIAINAQSNCILPVSCHEELVKYASSLLIGSVEGFDQSKFLGNEAAAV